MCSSKNLIVDIKQTYSIIFLNGFQREADRLQVQAKAKEVGESEAVV